MWQGSVTPPILARQCRALIRGSAEPDITTAAASCPSSRRSARNAARQCRHARLRPRLPDAEDVVRRGRILPRQPARPRQQSSRVRPSSKRAAPARQPGRRPPGAATAPARRHASPSSQNPRSRRAAARLGATARYSTNIVSRVNKVSKIIKV